VAAPHQPAVSRERTLERTQTVSRPLEEAFAFFGDARNLEAITPPWLRFRILDAPDALGPGAILRYRLRLFGVPLSWRTEIVDWRPPRTFTDVQVSGPYPLWEHTHRLTPVADGTEIHDHVRYRLPGGPLEPLVAAVVGRWLAAIFAYRAERTAALLAHGQAGQGPLTHSG
jgi:ligand-binding SRPBCC domain-containing protein